MLIKAVFNPQATLPEAKPSWFQYFSYVLKKLKTKDV